MPKKLTKSREELRELVAKNPVPFLATLSTYDPHSEPPIRPFPIREKPYLQEITRVWLEEPLLLIQKSRQMLVSWLFCALYLWDALFHEGRYIFFQSQKEDDAGFGAASSSRADQGKGGQLPLLGRVQFMVENMGWDCHHVVRRKPPMIYFPMTGSTIHAVSQDSDAFRTYTASGIFADELAFQIHAEEAYSAVKPTLDGGGRYTGVSTPNGKNFFYRMCFDVVE